VRPSRRTIPEYARQLLADVLQRSCDRMKQFYGEEVARAASFRDLEALRRPLSTAGGSNPNTSVLMPMTIISNSSEQRRQNMLIARITTFTILLSVLNATIVSRAMAADVQSIPSISVLSFRRLRVRCPLNIEESLIHYEEGDLSTYDASELVWCRASCGRTVHKTCFEPWRAQCEATSRRPTCILCRAKWVADCRCTNGPIRECTATHARRRAVTGDCPICLEPLLRSESDASFGSSLAPLV